MQSLTLTTWAAAILGCQIRAVLYLWRTRGGWRWELRTDGARCLVGREGSADDARLAAWRQARRRRIGILRIREIEGEPPEVAAA